MFFSFSSISQLSCIFSFLKDFLSFVSHLELCVQNNTLLLKPTSFMLPSMRIAVSFISEGIDACTSEAQSIRKHFPFPFSHWSILKGWLSWTIISIKYIVISWQTQPTCFTFPSVFRQILFVKYDVNHVIQSFKSVHFIYGRKEQSLGPNQRQQLKRWEPKS